MVPGPGCPSVCGTFVECALDRRSGGGFSFGGIAYDLAEGSVALPPQVLVASKVARLANKQIVPITSEFQCPNSDCSIPRAFLNDDYCDCPDCADEEFHSCEDCGVDLAINRPSFSDAPTACPSVRCRDPVIDRFRFVQCSLEVLKFHFPRFS